MDMILFKPNPFIDGVFGRNNGKDFNVFNNILLNLQVQKGNNGYIANINLTAFQEIINDKNINTAIKIQSYLTNTFREKTITWKYKTKIYSVGLIDSVIFDESTKVFEITVNKHLVDFALNYKEKKVGYTPLNLSLNSGDFYASKLYEIIRQWSGTKKEINIGLEELKEKLGLEGKYKEYKDFKKRVLNPAKDEIKAKFNMEIEFEGIKLGNKVTTIKFTVIDNEPRKYEFAIDELAIDSDDNRLDPLQNLLLQYKMKIISMNTLNKLKEEFGQENVADAIKIMGENNKKEKIGAPVRYLTTVLENIKNKEENESAETGSNYSSNNSKRLKNNKKLTPEEITAAEDLEKKLLGWE